MRRRTAFSLLELLVALVIIALIIGLLVPAVSHVRQSSLVAKDLTQLRAIQTAHWTYMMDHNGMFIDVGLPHGGLPNEDMAWINTLKGYFDNTLVVRSPLDRSRHWPADEGGDGIPVPGTNDHFRRTSYGCNNYLSRNFSPMAAIDPSRVTDRIAKVRNPARTVDFLHMAFTGAYAGADHVHVEEWWVNNNAPELPPIQAASQTQTDAAGGREASWEARSNYGFLDGHSETRKFLDVYRTDEINLFDPDVSFRLDVSLQ